MSKIGRRSLLLSASSLGLAALLPGVAFADAPPAAKRRRVLVVAFLRGGLDGLSLGVPHGDAGYYSARRGIAIAAPGKTGGAIDLDGHFGLHPRLAPLVPAYRAGELALVHAVGSPHGTRSHFEAQDYAETAMPGARSVRDGWLGRALVSTGRTRAPLGVVALSSKRPLALRGSLDVVSAKRIDRFALRAPKKLDERLTRGFEALYADNDDPVTRAGHNALDVARRLRDIDRSVDASTYPQGARPLAEVAALIRADVGLEVAWIDVGGWDTHQGQGNSESGRLPRLFDGLGKGLAQFRADLGERFADVVVLVMTEFGRTVAENGTGGTDHGHGSAMLVMGGPVRGGKVYGKWPGLAEGSRHEKRDLAVTTDYRDVLAELSTGHLGAPHAARVTPDYTPSPLGLLR